MKKALITLFIVAVFCKVASAQYNYGSSSNMQKGDVEFGIDAGYGLSYLDFGDNYSSILGTFNAGISADIYLSDRWGLKLKVIYDQKGASGSYVFDSNGNEIDGLKARFNYITIPLMLSWHFGQNANWYEDIGPYIGFLNSAKIGPYDVKSDFNKTDGGLSQIIGVKFPSSSGTNFFIELEIQQGLVNVSNNDDYYGSQSWVDRGSINVGLNF